MEMGLISTSGICFLPLAYTTGTTLSSRFIHQPDPGQAELTQFHRDAAGLP